MRRRSLFSLVLTALAGAAALMPASPAMAQAKEIKIGAIFDLTGPFAGGG